MKRKYFQRLFIAFLFAAIVPICICVLAISYGNHKMTIDRYSRKAEEMAEACSRNMDDLISEYSEVLESLSNNSDLKGYLKGRKTDPEQILKPMQTGRDGRIRLHIINLETMEIYPEAKETSLYQPSLYYSWGIIEQMNSYPKELVIFPNCTDKGTGQSICLNLGRAVLSADGSVLGYVVIDLYRDNLLNAVRNTEDDDLVFTVLDAENRVILGTTGQFEEGKTIECSRTLEGFILEQKDSLWGLKLNAYYNIMDFYENSRMLLVVTAVAFIITLMVSFILASVFANRMYRPIDTLVRSMNDVIEGKLDIKIDINEHDSDEMKMVSSVFNWMINRICILIQDAKEESERKKNAELKALQAQISPHFLYNMLNEIKALAKMGRTQEIAEFVIHLGKMLRRSIAFQDGFVSLEEDLKFVDDYVRLQQIRYDQLFSAEISADTEVLKCRIPNLIIQPLAENAIIHGFTEDKDHYTLRVRCYREGDKLQIEIYDNGIGVEDAYLNYINNVEKGVRIYSGLGVENVQKRLVLIYGMQYGLKMESQKGKYTRVTITLPYDVE